MQSDRYDLLNITTFLQELKQRQNLVNIVCDLYSSGLTLEAVLQIAELMQAQAGVFALDLSLNGSKVSSWAEVCRLARKFLDAVELLDLSISATTAVTQRIQGCRERPEGLQEQTQSRLRLQQLVWGS